jgi:hypothetical protein
MSDIGRVIDTYANVVRQALFLQEADHGSRAFERSRDPSFDHEVKPLHMLSDRGSE